MTLIEFAKHETNNRLSFSQLDLLELLDREPDVWLPKLPPANHEVRAVLKLFSEWKERQNDLVAC